MKHFTSKYRDSPTMLIRVLHFLHVTSPKIHILKIELFYNLKLTLTKCILVYNSINSTHIDI